MAIMVSPALPECHRTYICEMMECLGIEPGGGVVPRLSLSYMTAFHRCEACPSKQACRTWLDELPQLVTFAPRFCPNGDILFELQVNQPSLNRCVFRKSKLGRNSDDSAKDRA